MEKLEIDWNELPRIANAETLAIGWINEHRSSSECTSPAVKSVLDQYIEEVRKKALGRPLRFEP